MISAGFHIKMEFFFFSGSSFEVTVELCSRARRFDFSLKVHCFLAIGIQVQRNEIVVVIKEILEC